MSEVLVLFGSFRCEYVFREPRYFIARRCAILAREYISGLPLIAFRKFLQSIFFASALQLFATEIPLRRPIHSPPFKNHRA